MDGSPSPPGDDPGFTEALRRAVASSAILPAFQPIVRLDDHVFCGFEVLARWTDDLLGPIPPSHFIPAAERLGLMTPLTAQIIRVACDVAGQWSGNFHLAFNISPLHFQDGEMPGLFEDSVRSTGFPLSRTLIEITETAVIADLQAARATTDLLRSKGVGVVLDDFGMGHSSLARLQALAFDKIKIDASFVGTMETSPDSRKIVGAVIRLGQSLGASIVAEGVETEPQADLLRRLGCDFGQGWLFARALLARDVPSMLGVSGRLPGARPSRDIPPAPHGEGPDAARITAPVCTCFVDRDLRILDANRRWAAMLGLEPEDIIGRSLGEVHPDAVAETRGDLARALTGRAVRSRTWPLPGERRGLLTVAPAQDETGDLIGLSLVIVEVPARS